MKRARSVAAVLALFLLLVPNADASCPVIHLVTCCGSSWYQFDVNSTCVTTSGVSSTTLASCSSFSAYKYNPGVGNSASWSFVVPADGTPIAGGGTYARLAHWSATVYVDFASPTHSNWDSISGTVQVYHNGTTSYSIFAFNGATSSSQDCSTRSVNFSAVNGDTITITITGGGDSGATVKAAFPIIVNTN